jgi:DNA-binding XRE family transcriptional regulator/desulfoferrodoxin (superoxide reductase-like protein)
MDLTKTGKLIASLRKEKGLTQKEVAEKLGISPKTVSKWETGHGFPDVSLISELSAIFSVDISKLLDGEMPKSKTEACNMKRTKFYVCPHCGSFMQGVGNSSVICCGKQLENLKINIPDDEHIIKVSEIEDDFYIELNHEMTKEHYIGFVAYVRFDRVLTIKLYPEQDATVRFPKMFGGKLYYYCNRHGLFEFKIPR